MDDTDTVKVRVYLEAYERAKAFAAAHKFGHRGRLGLQGKKDRWGYERHERMSAAYITREAMRIGLDELERRANPDEPRSLGGPCGAEHPAGGGLRCDLYAGHPGPHCLVTHHGAWGGSPEPLTAGEYVDPEAPSDD